MQGRAWWVDLFVEIESVDSRDRLAIRMSQAAQELGFEYWAYGVRPAEPFKHDKVLLENTYPKGWVAHYLEHSYLALDPTVSIAAQRASTVTWNDAKKHGGRRLWMDAADFGLNVGIAQPVWNRSGAFGLLTLARAKVEIEDTELFEIAPHLTWLASKFHTKFSSLELNDSEEFQLSPREIEILRWSARGKTATEVALIVGIAPRTVNFHVANILAKMNVQNKVQASARATSLGLI